MNTTLNVRTVILQEITRAAQAEGITCSEMIVILLKKAMRDINTPDCMGRLVQYQARRRREEWTITHVRWRGDDYEYFQDMRKLLKMSVSLLLAPEVKKYLVKTCKVHKSDNLYDVT